MTTEQIKAEGKYRASAAILKIMLNKGLISDKEYAVIDTNLLKKYRPILGSL